MNTHLYRTLAILVLVLSQVGSSGATAYAYAEAAPVAQAPIDTSYRAAQAGSQSITITGVAAGAAHTCALTAGSGVKCWGYNGSGRLGDGTTTSRSTPVDVSGLISGVAALAAGGGHTCALTAGGGVKCWGNNSSGQLGDGTTTDRLTPVDVSGLAGGVAALAAGGDHTCAVTEASGVKCWGANGYGQLGDGTATSRSTPVDVSGLTSGVAALTAGGTHTCALTTGGGIKCWGYNGSGQLGDGTYTTRLTPVDVSGLTSGLAALAAGGYLLSGGHTCALTTGGGAKCWGGNASGQLGDGTTTGRLMPTDVSGLTSGVAALAAGAAHTCAVTLSGGAKCWGANGSGQLGDGTTTTRLTPVNVFLPVYCYLPMIFSNPYYCPVFYDNFSNPGSGWAVGEDGYVRAEYLNGEYRILTKQAGYLYGFRAPTRDRGNYMVEVDARWYGSTGSSYGLLFGLTGGFSRYYLFDVNTDFQAFRVYRREPSGFIPVVPGTTSSAIKTGTASNHLKATRNGSQITLEINGTVLGTWYDGAITGLTGVGLAVSPYSDRPNADARFDNFSLAVYGPCTSAATADRDTSVGPARPLEDATFAEPAPEDLYWQLPRKEIGP